MPRRPTSLNFKTDQRSRNVMRAPRGKAMPEESELGIVLANAPRLEKAFGRRWAAFITLVSLYFARKRPGVVGLMVSLALMAGLGIQAWLKVRG